MVASFPDTAVLVQGAASAIIAFFVFIGAAMVSVAQVHLHPPPAHMAPPEPTQLPADPLEVAVGDAVTEAVEPEITQPIADPDPGMEGVVFDEEDPPPTV
jgi:hypothetical protein